jgi:DNA replication protein DnaC
MGGNNSGKTFIASIAVQEAIKNNLSAKYYDWSNLVDILSNFSRKEELNEAIESHYDNPALVESWRSFSAGKISSLVVIRLTGGP